MKKTVDLMIIGYPNESKVLEIINQLNLDRSNAQSYNIVLLNNILDELPLSFFDFKHIHISFIKGISSEESILKLANIENTKKVLILANHPDDIISDDYSISAGMVIKYINPNAYIIIEKVRNNETIFSLIKADLVIPISSPNIIAQEILDPGAIELANAIFNNNNTNGTQYNYTYNGKDINWLDLSIELISKNLIPEAYKSKDRNRFTTLPKKDDIIKNNYIVKYRAKKRYFY